MFLFQKQKQEETGAVKDDTLELKTWSKHTEDYGDDTEVNSQRIPSPTPWDWFLSQSHVLVSCTSDVTSYERQLKTDDQSTEGKTVLDDAGQ